MLQCTQLAYHPGGDAELCRLVCLAVLLRLLPYLLSQVPHLTVPQALNFYPPLEKVFSAIFVVVMLLARHDILDQDIRHPTVPHQPGPQVAPLLPTLGLNAGILPVHYHWSALPHNP